MINRADYITDPEWNRFLDFSRDLETPCVVINLHTVKRNYIKLRDLFPYAQFYYAVKANPEPAVAALLAELGASFDIASRPELDMVLSLGVSPDRISFGNTIKKARDVASFYERGVRMFATDSREDLKIIMLALVAVGISDEIGSGIVESLDKSDGGRATAWLINGYSFENGKRESARRFSTIFRGFKRTAHQASAEKKNIPAADVLVEVSSRVDFHRGSYHSGCRSN
jgi:hypothetical protein